AVEGDIVFAESPKLLEEASASKASAIISLPEIPDVGRPMILVQNPRLAFAKVLEVFSQMRKPETGIHPSSFIGAGTTIGSNPSIGFNVSIGCDVVIGDNVWIYPFVHIGDGAHIGDDCVVHPFVSIYDRASIGNRVIIHGGSVIGADGFGYTKAGDKHYKIPQIGTVMIGDDVEVGANVTIDRARTGVTRIGSGTKIDNLVQIGHNVNIGENCIVISQTGISGSVEIGDRVLITGQAGIKDHVKIGHDSVLAGRAGIMNDVDPGSFLSGYPARPHKESMKVFAAENRLPELVRTIKSMEKRIKELEERIK
ncbi:MAG TPA: UDP-3-O-(3-hydroxymyristoyl)glucosamine N-acyltransferase, partial [Armatimonadota bacterium]